MELMNIIVKIRECAYICGVTIEAMTRETKIIIGLVFVAIVSRIAPHYPNFTAIGALSFFSAMQSKSLLKSLSILFGTLMVSDVIINNLIYPTGQFVLMYPGSVFTYLGFGVYSLLGLGAKANAKGLGRIVIGSLFFFAISNFGVWFSDFSLFPKTAAGLIATYAVAIPFYAPELIATLLFTSATVLAKSRLYTTEKA
jgi:hypothetical protein